MAELPHTTSKLSLKTPSSKKNARSGHPGDNKIGLFFVSLLKTFGITHPAIILAIELKKLNV